MRYLLLPLVFSLVMFQSCKQTNNPASCNLYCVSTYENSFESEEDIKGWIGLNKDMLTEEDAFCGFKSLLIGGGCIQPAAYYDYLIEIEGFYYVRVQGKMNTANQTGMITIYNFSDKSQEMSNVSIDKMEWQTYNSDYVLMREGDTLRIELFIGGIKEASMFIDCLNILKTDPDIEPM